MAQRPTVKQPKPLTAPVDPQRLEADAAGLAGARVLGDVKAEVSPEAAPLWEFVLTHARAIALACAAVYEDPSIAAKAKEELLEETGGQYNCPIPAELSYTDLIASQN